MIPKFNQSGVIPPFLAGPAVRAGCSPFAASMSELAIEFGHSAARRNLLRGLLAFRAALAAAGVSSGYQLIDGSFVEDCESLRGRAPGDIDLVTFAITPVDPAAKRNLLARNPALFDENACKATYGCHAFFVDLTVHPGITILDTMYFFGLFSHQRLSNLWKGTLLVNLLSDDAAAAQAIPAN